MSETFTGINIQFPISTLILSGEKTVETRTYPIPKDYVGKRMLMIETPGRSKAFKARAVAILTFGDSFAYRSREEFYKDASRHRVSHGSAWAWDDSKPKWGWPITSVVLLENPKELHGPKGIRFTTGLSL